MPQEKVSADTRQQPAGAWETVQANATQAEMPPLVSGRWILAGIGGTVLAAVLCAWFTLCVLFWQGSWQLLYHPAAAVTQTPASAGIQFEPVAFASDDAGQPRLSGWWIPASTDTLTARFNRYTVLYLHGQTGNLSNTVAALAMLHAAGVNVLAFDYRGYGKSQFARPSEAHWRADAEWALKYLTETRHVSAGSILLYGDELGANLALEAAALHPELAGVVVQQPVANPVAAILNDPRAQMVPARLLMRDRYDLNAAADKLRIASLWLFQAQTSRRQAQPLTLDAFLEVTAPKKLGWVQPEPSTENDCRNALMNWMDGLGH